MRKSARASVDAMLRHLASHHDPKDFPSTAYERQDLIEAAGKRRLIVWQKERRRYELTPAGARRLRHGRLGLPALVIAAGIGAAAGATALAMFWLPAERSVGDGAALGPPVESARAPSPASPPVTSAAAPATASGAAAAPGAAPAEAATGAEQPAATQPDGEPATTAAKEPAGKKSRRTGRAGWRRNWNLGHYRDERFAGSGR
jgi:hypothetical protein